MTTSEFFNCLVKNNIVTGSGVYDEFFDPLFDEIKNRKDFYYLSLYSPEAAFSFSSGINLLGTGSCVFIPNTNLWNIGNIVTTFNSIYGIPTLLITSWRGEPRVENKLEYAINGQLLFDVLEDLGLYWTFPSNETKVNFACNQMRETNKLSAIIIRKDEFGR